MSRTAKEGKRSRIVRVREAVASVLDAVQKRHVWGRTEKILRRNRRLWERLTGKRRRRADREVTREGMEE